MNNKRALQRIKILASMAFSFLLVIYIAPQIFLNNTSAVKPRLLSRIKIIPYSLYAYIRHPFDKNQQEKTRELASIQRLPKNSSLSYNPISRGVYAAQDPENAAVHVKVESGTALEVRTITLNNGQTLKVFIPVK